MTTPKVGETIGPFTLVKVLGQGGMGAVYVARHTNGVECALKVLLDPSPGLIERFGREITAMRKAESHPGVVKIHTAGKYGPQNLPYVVMDLIRGTDLSKLVGGRPMEPLRAATLVAQVSEAIEFCHEKGVIHRDLKPANILVRQENQQPVVTDFGLARDDTAERLTKTGEVLGTPAYMAPEQLEGDRNAQDARTDVYALGAILYECLTGEPPFKADSPTRLMKMVLIDDPVDPRKKVGAVPVELSVIALKCLAKDKERRYASAKEVAAELERVRRNEPILAKPESAAEKKARWKKNHHTEWLLRRVASVALAACIVAVVALRGRGRDYSEILAETTKKLADQAYPALPEGLPPDIAALVSALRAAAGDALATDPRTREIDRWARYATDPDRALAAALKEPPRTERESLLDSLAASRTRDPRLKAAVLARVEPPLRPLLAAHGEAGIGKLTEAYEAVAKSAEPNRAWTPVVRRDLARALQKSRTDRDAAAIHRGLLFVANAWPDQLGDLAATLAPPEWDRLGAASTADAVRIVRGAGRDRLSAEGLAAVATHISTKVEKVLGALEKQKIDLEKIVGDLFDIEALGARPSDAIVDFLCGMAATEAFTSALDTTKGKGGVRQTVRLDVLVVVVASGVMPDGTRAFRPSRRNEDTPEMRLDDAKKRVPQVRSFIDKNKAIPLARLIGALAILHAAIEMDDALDDANPEVIHGPRKETEPYYEEGSALFLAVDRSTLSGHARAFEAYERAYLLLRGALRDKGLKKHREAHDDPAQLALAVKALDEAKEYAHSQPWRLLEGRVDVKRRLYEHLTHKVVKGFEREGDKPTPEEARQVLERAAPLLDELLPAIDQWRAALEVVFDEAETLFKLDDDPETKKAMTSAQVRRHHELSNIYMVMRGDTDTNAIKLKAESRRRLAILHLVAGDENAARPLLESSADELQKAVAANPNRASFHKELAGLRIMLGQKKEALKLIDEALATQGLGELGAKDKKKLREMRRELQ